jgi:hypothetical protein
MSVRFVPHIEGPRGVSEFERNMLQGGYLNINRGSARKSGWNRIIGGFMIIKSTNNLRIMGKNYEL